jgi:hypothetical protein
MLFLFLLLYSILTYVGKILGDFSGRREPVRIFYIEIKMRISFSIHEFSLYEQFSSKELRS